ncbi:unnamed protein product [Ectocarpus sp. 12 AP-2014]
MRYETATPQHTQDPGVHRAPERPALRAGRVLCPESAVRPVVLSSPDDNERHLPAVRLANGRRQTCQKILSQGALVRG